MKQSDAMGTVIVLPSRYGDEFVRVVHAPPGVPEHRLLPKVAAVLDEAKRGKEDWTWEEDLRPALQYAGFTAVRTFTGPRWDET